MAIAAQRSRQSKILKTCWPAVASENDPMADIADEAQLLEQAARDRALAEHAARQQRIADSFGSRDPSKEGNCLDCDGPIEPQRLRLLPCCSRCATCAHAAERTMRGAHGS
jgi:RNA polymerase-binding transcription factor DksA